MARPPLPVGTAGEFRIYRTSKGFRARCLVRDVDGVVRDIGRSGRTKEQARNRLREAIRDRMQVDASAEITPTTKVRELAELWFAEFCDLERSPTTIDSYRYQLDRHVLPALGELHVREVKTWRLDRLIKTVRSNVRAKATASKPRRGTEASRGASAAKALRTVLNGMMGLAVRHGALDANPVRDVARIESGRAPTRSLTLAEAQDLRGKLHVHEKAAEWDLVDFADMMLGSGLRIGETSAVVWDAIDFVAGTVEVRGTVIRVKGVGLVLKPKPKSKAGWRTVELAGWTVDMLRRRKPTDAPSGGLVFPAPLGGLRDPSNTNADLRRVFDEVGYEWITSHVFRRTVATLMDAAGLSARAAADQLGHAKVSMTQDHYFGRKVARTGAAEALRGIASTSAGDEQ